jgi:hypothetical protein
LFGIKINITWNIRFRNNDKWKNFVQRVMHSSMVSPRSLDVVFKRIGFAIQKGLAAQLVARLSSIKV